VVAYSNVAFVGSIGGGILAAAHTPPWTIFALVALGTATHGLASVIAVRYTIWGIDR